jgi:hypothetical protein
MLSFVHRYQPDVWAGADAEGPLTSDDYVIKSFIVFLYYSTTTITSTGYGDVYPDAWYLYLLVASEMLLGVLYQVCGAGHARLSPQHITQITPLHNDDGVHASSRSPNPFHP